MMEKLCEIGSEEMQLLYDLKQKKFRIEKILDDPVFKRQISAMQSDVPEEKLIELEELIGPFPKKKKKPTGDSLIDNLKVFLNRLKILITMLS